MSVMPGRRRPRCRSDWDDGGLEERETGLPRPAEATDEVRPSESFPAPLRFDLKNFAVGAVVSSLLVGLIGYGTIIFFQAITPGEEGVNIGGALLASLGCLLAVALGAGFTARRACRRASQPMPEGIGAGLVGFMLAVLAVGYLFFVVRGVPLLEIVNLLPLLGSGVGAALAGAALGGLGSNNDQPH